MVDLHKGVHGVHDAVADAGAQVEDLGALILGGELYGGYVALGQVHHMDVVPDAGAVGGGIVVAEDAQLLPAANGHLGDVGHQVVGDASGILTHQAGLVSADGVEVAQQHHGPVGIRVGNAGEDLLGHVFGPAVGIGAAAGAAGLLQGHFVVRGVDRGGGGEDDVLHPHLFHDLGQDQGGIEVVVVIFPGLFHAFAYSLQPGEVDDAGDVVLGKNLAQQGLIPDIALVEFNGLAGDLLHPLQAHRVGVHQIVDDYHAIAVFQQLHTGVGANVPGTAGNQYVHVFIPPLFAWR